MSGATQSSTKKFHDDLWPGDYLEVQTVRTLDRVYVLVQEGDQRKTVGLTPKQARKAAKALKKAAKAVEGRL